jgi:hypothetical protein
VTAKEDRLGLCTEAIEKSLAGDLTYNQFTARIGLDPVHEARILGFVEGWEARQPTIDRLTWTADRLYTEVCRRTPPKIADRPPFAQLQRTRDEIYGGAR